METTVKKLWNRNFTLLVAGQLMSIFGNQILTFALPLYVLQTHESPALFGTVLGLSFIPLILTSPIGGIMADRLRKQRVMFWLDVITTALIVLYMVVSNVFPAALVLIVTVKLLALNAIQGFYMPCVQGGLPFLVPQDRLTQANSATSAVNTLSSMAAPALAGVLLGRFGLAPILVAGAICFAITAVMDLLIRFPYEKKHTDKGVLQIAKSDMAEALCFVKARPLLIKIAVMMFIVSLLASGILIVGVPVFILRHLGMSMEQMGIGRSISWSGALLGAAIVGYLGERLTIKSVPMSTILLGLSFIPIGLALLLDIHYFAAFAIFIASDFIFTVIVLLYMLPMWAYMQRFTPEDLIGKVMSLFTALPFFASGVGFLVFGRLFERFYSLSWLIVFITAFLMVITALLLRKGFRETKADADTGA